MLCLNRNARIFVFLTLIFLFFDGLALAQTNKAKRKNKRTKNVIIDDAQDLIDFVPMPSQPELQPFLDQLFQQFFQGVDDNVYHFNLSKKVRPSNIPQNAILNQQRNRVLESFVRSPKDENLTCSTRYKVDELLTGDDLATATQGVCGPISVLHSLVRLGIKTQEEIVDGDFLNEEELGALRKFQTKFAGISDDELKMAYASAGAGTCMERDLFRIRSKKKLNEFNLELKAKMDSTDPIWDCTLQVYNINSSGKRFLAHSEPIVSVSSKRIDKKRIRLKINTINTLTQGNQSTTVPASPGINTWTTTPGNGNRSMILTGTTAAPAERKKIARSLPLVTHTKYICCRK